MAFIVLVDDDISVLTPLTEQLESEGYKVQAFQSSIDAKEFFKKNAVPKILNEQPETIESIMKQKNINVNQRNRLGVIKEIYEN